MAQRKPRIGQVFPNVDQYWEKTSAQEPWAFDFISIHGPKQDHSGQYTLVFHPPASMTQ